MIGTKVARFEITPPVGEGRMGEVYRARGTKLDRVATEKAVG